MKILIWGIAPFLKTAYGIQGYQLAKLFQELGHQVLYLSYSGLKNCQINYNGIDVIAGEDNGLSLLGYLIKSYQPQFILQFFDLWTLPIEFQHQEKLTVYTPIDSSPMPWRLQMQFPRMKNIISMSRFHQKECEKIGLKSTLIPHFVDDTTFCPRDRREARKGLDWEEDAFVVGINAVNLGLRKNFEGMLQGFASVYKRAPNLKLALWTWARRDAQHPEAVDLIALLDYLKISFDDVYFADQAKYMLGASSNELALWYNGLDCLMLCSLGEGFGIPVVEAALCKVPSIVSNHSSLAEFRALKVKARELVWFPLTQALMLKSHSEDIANALVTFIKHPDLAHIIADDSYQQAKVDYTPIKVRDHWQNYFKKVAQAD